ncbi:MAG TPA: TonB family protein [Rhodanobacteraceae bacterium]|nr:TonB family protein [Rhodanobacteraceae bacterium]
MKRIAFGLAVLLMSASAFAQPIDVSSQPVPGLFNSNDTRAAIQFAMTATDKPLSEYVQKCYFKTAREYPVGSVMSYQAVAFCAEIDMAGIILNEHSPQQDAYFSVSAAENRIGTELISFAGLNTYQAYQTINWLKAAMTPEVMPAMAKTPAPIAEEAPRPMSGKCSIPRPDYPIKAMRQGKQGVATVAFGVTMDGHTSEPSISSSSGSSDLDNAALAAVARGVCSAPAGTHLSRAITFSLQGVM